MAVGRLLFALGVVAVIGAVGGLAYWLEKQKTLRQEAAALKEAAIVKEKPPAPPPPPPPPKASEAIEEVRQKKLIADAVPESIGEAPDGKGFEYCNKEHQWYRVDLVPSATGIALGDPVQIQAPSNPPHSLSHPDAGDPTARWKDYTARRLVEAERDVAAAEANLKSVEEQINLARKGIVIMGAPEEVRKTAKGPLYVFPSEPARVRRIAELTKGPLAAAAQELARRQAALRTLQNEGLMAPPLRAVDLAIGQSGRLVEQVTVAKVINGSTTAFQCGGLTIILEGPAAFTEGSTVTLPPVHVIGTRMYQGTVVFRLRIVKAEG